MGKPGGKPGLSNRSKRKGGKCMTLYLWARIVLAFSAITAAAGKSAIRELSTGPQVVEVQNRVEHQKITSLGLRTPKRIVRE